MVGSSWQKRWSLGGVGAGRVFGVEEEGGGVRSGAGEAETILLLLVHRPVIGGGSGGQGPAEMPGPG